MKRLPDPSARASALRAAQASLREARRLAALGGSDKTTARVRAALNSVAGALRHAQHAEDRAFSGVSVRPPDAEAVRWFALTERELDLLCEALDRAEDQIRDEAREELARGFEHESADHAEDADAMSALLQRLGSAAALKPPVPVRLKGRGSVTLDDIEDATRVGRD